MQKQVSALSTTQIITNQCCRTADGKKELKCLFVLVLICISLLDLLEKTIKEYIGWLGYLIIELNFLWVEIKRVSLMSQKWVLLTSLFPYLIALFIFCFSLNLMFSPQAVIQKFITLMIQDSKNKVKILLSIWNLEIVFMKWILWLTFFFFYHFFG